MTDLLHVVFDSLALPIVIATIITFCAYLLDGAIDRLRKKRG